MLIPLTYDKTHGPITRVHTYVSSFLNPAKFRVYMFERVRLEVAPKHIVILRLPRIKAKPFSPSTYKVAIEFIANLLKLPMDILHTPIYPEFLPMMFLRRILRLDSRLILSFHGVPLDSYKHYVASRILSKRANIITSVSHFTAKLVKELYDLDSIVIHNGIDTDFYHPKKHYNSHPKVLFVGRLIKWKRPHWVAKLAKDFPNAEFIIHGPIPKTGVSVYPYIHKLAEKLPNLKLDTQYMPIESLRELYQNADVFCFPSTDWDPLSVMEALACGLPLIVHAVGGQSELVEDGKEGFKIKSYSDMKEKLQYVLEDENLRKIMSINARRKALQYDWRNVAKEYEKLYEDAL